MRTRKPASSAATATVTAVVLALALGASACSGGGSADEDRIAKRSSLPSARTGPSLPEASRFPVPEGFDNTQGWTEAVSEPDSRTHGSWAVAPAAGLFIQVMNAEGKVHARRLGGGREAWTYRAPTKLEGASTDVYVATGPEGDELAVIVREGRTVGEGLDRGGSLLTVDTVPVVSRGKAKAARHVEYEDSEAGPFTGALLVSRKADASLLALDPFTGKDSNVKGQSAVRLAGCRTADLAPGVRCSAPTTAAFATPTGPVSTYTQDGYCDYAWKPTDYVPCGEGFTVGDTWRSEKVAPDGAADGTPLAVVGPYMVVDWTRFPEAKTEEESKRDVVAVHALADGKLVARVDCDITGEAAGTGSVGTLAAQAVSQLSPSGDYLVSGQVGFDLAAQRGTCFADTAGRRGVTLTAVGDTGRAFGVAYSESTWAQVPYGTFPHDFGAQRRAVPGRAVSADLRTGTARVLGQRTALPVHLAEDTGLFLTSGTLACYPKDPDADGEEPADHEPDDGDHAATRTPTRTTTRTPSARRPPARKPTPRKRR